MVDWINALSAQDKSLEGMMARRNLQPQLESLARIAQEKERQRIAQEQHAAEMAAAEKERQEALAFRRQQQEQMNRERETDNKRQRYSIVQGNLKPGDRMRRGPDFDLMNEFGTGTQFEADPNDPDSFIYRKAEYDQLQAKLKTEQELEKAREKRAQRDQQLQEQAEKRAQAEEKRREQREQRASQQFERRQQALDKQLSAMPVEIRNQAAKEAQVITSSMEQGMFEDDAEYRARVHQAIAEAYDRHEQKAIAAGLMSPKTPKVDVGGGKPKKTADDYLREEGIIKD